MTRSIGRRAITAVVGAVAFLATFGLSFGASQAVADEVVPPAASPTEVEVPYLGSTTIEPAAGWRISDCGPPEQASPLVTACDAEHIVLTAEAYDPEAGAIPLPVPQTNGGTSMVFRYVVRLAPPETPVARDIRFGYPVAAGSTVMIPISVLDIECAVCKEGGRLDVVGVEPAGAGTAGATSTHLVFRPSASYAGLAGVGLRFADDFGTWSPEATVEIPVYRPEGVLVAMNVFVAADGESQTIDLNELAFDVGGAEISLLGCGAPIHGSVVCRPDGIAEFRSRGAAVDQFDFHVASSEGEQASGSVTVVGDGAELPVSGPVPATTIDADDDDGDDAGVVSAIVPRVPVESDSTERVGVFAPLIRTLDRAGVQ